MSYEDFVKSIAGSELNPKTHELQFKTLFKLADSKKKGRLSFEDYSKFVRRFEGYKRETP